MTSSGTQLAAVRDGFHMWLWGLAALLLSSSAAWPQDGPGLFEEHKGAVVKLEVTGVLANGKHSPPRAGTGFIVYSGKPHTIILTAAHVLGPASEWDQENGTIKRDVRVRILDEHGKLVVLTGSARVHTQNDAQDWAVLLVDGEGFACVESGDPASAAPGASGALIGYESDSIVPGYAQGNITRVNAETYGFVLRLSMNVIHGQSGGPIFDARGRVLGIASRNEVDKLGFHIGVPVTLALASVESLLPTDGGTGDCSSAERALSTSLKVAVAHQRAGRLQEYVTAAEAVLRNRELLAKLSDAKRLRTEVDLHLNIALELMGEDYIEGVAEPKQSAMAHLEQARLLDPGNALVLIMLGFTRASEAADRVSNPAAVAPEISALFAEALRYADQGRQNGRLHPDVYARILVLHRYWFGRALMQLNQYDDAARELNRGLELAGQRASVQPSTATQDQFLYRLGQIEFDRSHDVSRAGPYWNKVSDPHYVGRALVLTGLGLWREGWELKNNGNERQAAEKFELAEEALAGAKQRGERSWNLSLTLGILYFNRRDYVDAASNFQEVARLEPRRAIGFYWLGRSKFMIGGKNNNAAFNDARTAMARAAELSPNDSDTHYWSGRILSALDQESAAITEYQRSIAINANNTKAYWPLVVALTIEAEKAPDPKQQTGLYEQALRRANDGLAAAKSSQDDAETKQLEEMQRTLWNSLAYQYAEQGEFLPLALDYIDKALKAVPDEPYYLDTKAWVSIRAVELSKTVAGPQRDEKLAEADRLLNKALRSLPLDAADARAETIFHLGYTEQLRGRVEAARARFLEALALNPGYQRAKEALNK